jgi:tetratricopeptide (TPR) repeat protein
MKTSVKIIGISILFVAVLFGIVFCRHFFSSTNQIRQIAGSRDDGLKKVYSRVGLEKQARRLAEAGNVDEAIDLYQQAIRPEYISQDHQKSTAIGSMMEIYKWKQNYGKALEMADWFSNASAMVPEKREIVALEEFQETGNARKVYEHIELLNKENQGEIPPHGRGLESELLISDILRLYNTIGDHDAGIKFIDECMEYLYYRKSPDSKRVNTSKEAYRYVIEPGEKTPHRLDWLFYKDLWEYLKIREAFEQDKADGFKGCANSKPGEVCMGKATKALIESDYFPW